MARVVTITDPVELLLAQLAEVHDGNAQTRKEIVRLQHLLYGGEKEEAKMKRELEELRAKERG